MYLGVCVLDTTITIPNLNISFVILLPNSHTVGTNLTKHRLWLQDHKSETVSLLVSVSLYLYSEIEIKSETVSLLWPRSQVPNLRGPAEIETSNPVIVERL